MSNKIKGKYGEDLAVNYLIKNKYKILDRNYHFSRFGEIDIIALYSDTVCFVEVKTRTSEKFGTAFEAITKEKLSKILKCALNYMQNSKYNKFRIDAISVFLGANGEEIHHIKNIEL